MDEDCSTPGVGRRKVQHFFSYKKRRKGQHFFTCGKRRIGQHFFTSRYRKRPQHTFTFKKRGIGQRFFTSGSTSEPVSSDERLSQTPSENECGRRKKNPHPIHRRQCEPYLLLSPVSLESKSLSSDDTITPVNSPIRGDEDCIIVPKEEVISSIKEIVEEYGNSYRAEEFSNFNRIQFASNEEKSGHIELHVIANSISKQISNQNLMRLITYRNLVAHELPKMNKRYITRLIFDSKHENLILLKEGKVIGGICFRMFPARDFSEIVFLTIASNQHVKGYGTHMLNHLKDYHIRKNVHHLLTCADKKAFGYFEKQGFSSYVKLDKSVYTGYIKLYHAATLMECRLDRRITYTMLSDVISRHKMILTKLAQEYKVSNEEVSDEEEEEEEETETDDEESEEK